MGAIVPLFTGYLFMLPINWCYDKFSVIKKERLRVKLIYLVGGLRNYKILSLNFLIKKV